MAWAGADPLSWRLHAREGARFDGQFGRRDQPAVVARDLVCRARRDGARPPARPGLQHLRVLLFPRYRRRTGAGRRRVRGVATLPRPAAGGQGRDRHEQLPPRLHGAQDLADPDLVGRQGHKAQRLRVVHADARGPARRSALRPAARRPEPVARPARLPRAGRGLRGRDACLLPAAVGADGAGARPAARLVPALLRPADYLPAPAALPAAGKGCARRRLRLGAPHRLWLHHHPLPGQ